jgi:signal transduction histidine kinase
MPRLFRSLRVRLTALVVLAVGVALALASLALLTIMSHSLVGGVQRAAAAKVDEVADSLAKGRSLDDIQVPQTNLTVIQIQDARGRVVQQIPQPPTGPAHSILPESVREARAAAQAEQPQGAEAGTESVVAWRTVSTPAGARTVLAVSRLGSVTQSLQLVANSLLLATPMLTILVGVLTWFVVDRALRPIEAVRRRAEVISHTTLDERLPEPRTSDEVGRLTATLNEMLGRLDDGVRRQREFVSNASHELRTPLAAIRADLEVSLAHRSGADWPGLARRLLDDHRRIEHLASDLLTLARLDDALAMPDADPIRLDQLVESELRTVRRAELRSVLEPVEVRGVASDLVRLVRNLLENADRHAVSQVDVYLDRDGGAAVLVVDDDGPGIPAEQRDRVFHRFYRLDSSRARLSGGTGLGLAMVRRITANHGGEVQIDVAPLGGARFAVRLPVAGSAFAKPA